MRFVTIDASVPTRAAAEVFRTLADYARYPRAHPRRPGRPGVDGRER